MLGRSESLHCPVRRWCEPVREVSLRAGPPHTLPRPEVWVEHSGVQRKPLLRLVELAYPDFISKVAPGTCLPSSGLQDGSCWLSFFPCLTQDLQTDNGPQLASHYREDSFDLVRTLLNTAFCQPSRVEIL